MMGISLQKDVADSEQKNVNVANVEENEKTNRDNIKLQNKVLQSSLERG